MIKIAFFVLLITTNLSAFAVNRDSMDKPLLVGPQYPLIFSRTRFEPDSGSTLKAGETLFSLRYLHSNSYEFSENSAKDSDPKADANSFLNTTKSGYSVYLDAEVFKRMLSFNFGLTDSIEFQSTYREISFSGGNLDETIESFHDTFGLGNRERVRTKRNQFEIYVYDNENNIMVYQFTNPRSGYQTESLSLGLKFMLQEAENENLSFKVTSNFFDRYLERETNEIEGGTKDSDVNDYNVSLNYSSYYQDFTVFAAYSRTHMDTPIFKRSPNQFQYIFMGINYHSSEDWDLLMQALVYTSVFPDDSDSTLGQDLVEITSGIRFFFTEGSALEFGLVENLTQGPHNIDVAFFANLVFNL